MGRGDLRDYRLHLRNTPQERKTLFFFSEHIIIYSRFLGEDVVEVVLVSDGALVCTRTPGSVIKGQPWDKECRTCLLCT